MCSSDSFRINETFIQLSFWRVRPIFIDVAFATPSTFTRIAHSDCGFFGVCMVFFSWFLLLLLLLFHSNTHPSNSSRNVVECAMYGLVAHLVRRDFDCEHLLWYVDKKNLCVHKMPCIRIWMKKSGWPFLWMDFNELYASDAFFHWKYLPFALLFVSRSFFPMMIQRLYTPATWCLNVLFTDGYSGLFTTFFFIALFVRLNQWRNIEKKNGGRLAYIQ